LQAYGIALASLGGALAILGGYHFGFVAPRLRRLAAASATHDDLLGGGAAAATGRLAAIETELGALHVGRDRLEQRMSELERIARTEVHRVGFVRYNAFGDVGSELSFALALVNKEGDGVILNSIFSREETRTYGKAVQRFETVVDASKEELLALERARAMA
jgi:hypothetical protein